MARERESPSPSLPAALTDSGILLHDGRSMRLAAGSWGSILLAIPALFGLSRLVLWTGSWPDVASGVASIRGWPRNETGVDARMDIPPSRGT